MAAATGQRTAPASQNALPAAPRDGAAGAKGRHGRRRPPLPQAGLLFFSIPRQTGKHQIAGVDLQRSRRQNDADAAAIGLLRSPKKLAWIGEQIAAVEQPLRIQAPLHLPSCFDLLAACIAARANALCACPSPCSAETVPPRVTACRAKMQHQRWPASNSAGDLGRMLT